VLVTIRARPAPASTSNDPSPSPVAISRPRPRLLDQIGVELAAAHDVDRALESDVPDPLAIDDAPLAAGDARHPDLEAQRRQRGVRVSGEATAAGFVAREGGLVEAEDPRGQRRRLRGERHGRRDARRTRAGDDHLPVDGPAHDLKDARRG
jgi:hypothetical protein